MPTVQDEQRAVTNRLLARILAVFPMFNPDTIDTSWASMLTLIEAMVAQEHRVTASLAISEYMTQRRNALIVDSFTPAPAPLNVQALRTSLTVTGPVAMKNAIKRGVDPVRASKLALVQVQGSAMRYALAGSRDTTLTAVATDPQVKGWARISRANGCPFCLMLSTRGGAYKSKETALSSKSGSRYHDHCHCVVEPIFTDRDEWEPPTHIRKAEELYKESTKDLYGSGKTAQQAFAEALAAQRAS